MCPIRVNKGVNSYPLDKMAANLADDIFKCIFLTIIEFRFKFHWTGDKPLPEPMMTQFTDAYMRYEGEIGFK